MAVIKQKTRKRLTKVLARLVKKHGPEMTVALVTGIISAQVAERSNKDSKKGTKAEKPAKGDKTAKKAKAVPSIAKASAKPAVLRKRASA